MKLEVIRKHPDNGIETLGKLYLSDDAGATHFTCDTLELPYKDNKHKISCIPPGTYHCKKVGPSHIPYPHIAVQNVSGRDGICIHKANYVSDLLGCIGVGTGLADINKDGQLDIINSTKTFDALMLLLPDEFQLVIK